MKCLKCKSDNPDSRKFCRECGSKLSLPCSACGAENVPGDKFCGECGQDLRSPAKPSPKDLSFDEKLAKIQRYLPRGLTEKILSQRERIEGERKQVTVMFCDMAGFTTLSGKLGPEGIYSLMEDVYEVLIHKVHEYGGTVNELTGDGVMALFGAPITLEDAPQRSIRSALAIHREITRFNERPSKDKGIPPIRMRIGIHSGPVVLGTVGNDLRVDFKAMGDTVNLASRMESLAEPGTTYVTEYTFKLTEGFFRFEALGERQIKGKTEPIKVYQVIAPSTRRTRFDVVAERSLTPFVGRKRELELLMEAYERARGGRGQAAFIIAEAGVGKSRLLYEFRKAVSNDDVTFLEGKCLSYSREVSYHPVIDILKGNFDIHDEDGDKDIRDKVTRGLQRLGAEEETTLPYLLELLSVQDSGLDRIPMSPEAKRHRIVEALRCIVLKGSEIRTLIIAFEDLHWADKSSEEAIKELLDHISGSPILLLFTYRPEFMPSWRTRSYHGQVAVNRLSNRDSLRMVTHHLGTNDLSPDLQQLILEKTEGVPFFIEELVRSLKEQGLIERIDGGYRLSSKASSASIPSTVQDVIMARVDVLPDGAKELLQKGSVIEREFGYALIRRVSHLPEREFFSYLSVLNDTELLYERGVRPQSTFTFKHAITREVIYDSLLASKRRRLHEEIGKALEYLYADHVTDHCEALAHHYLASENHKKAAYYSRLAARKAEKSASFPEAIAYGKQRVISLERLPDRHLDRRELVEARTTLGLFMAQIFDFREARECIEPVFAFASETGDKKRFAQMQTILGCHHHWVREDFVNAFVNLEEAARTSLEIGDIVSMFFSNQWLGYAYGFCCQFHKALESLEKALEINTALNNLWGVCAIKASIAYCVHLPRGDIRRGYETTEQALSIAEKSGDIYSKAIAYVMHGFSSFQRGLFDEANEYLTKGIEFSEKTNFGLLTAHGRFTLGHVYFVLKRYQECINQYLITEQIWKQRGALPSLVRYIQLAAILARVCSEGYSVDWKSLFQLASQNRLALHEGSMWRCVSNILVHGHGDGLTEAQRAIERAMEADARHSTKWSLAMDHATYADILNRRHLLRETQENFEKALNILRACGADGWVQKVGEGFAAEVTDIRTTGGAALGMVP